MNLYPGEGVERITKNGKPIFYVPYIQIGSLIKGTVFMILPYQAVIKIHTVDGHDSKILYRGILNAQDIQDCKEYCLDEKLKEGGEIEATVVSYGDNNGIVLSCIKEDRSIKR